MNDELCKHFGADQAYQKIKSTLSNYLSSPPHFEQIFHCAHELGFLLQPTPGAVDEYKPLLQPFLSPIDLMDQAALIQLTKKMTEVIFSTTTRACAANSQSLEPLKGFLELLQRDHITRIYTTNYDDFPLQAKPDLYVGFDRATSTSPIRFDINQFWSKEDQNSLLHLHGSVHLGFPIPTVGEIGELFWFENREDALQNAFFDGAVGSDRRMDGATIHRAAVVTGLQKLASLQMRPLSHFYASLAKDAMTADIIFIIGSGLADLHLNTWLFEARRRDSSPPLLFVDYYDKGFETTYYEMLSAKEIALFHRLNVQISERHRGTRVNNWLVSHDRNAARLQQIS